jgi:hypothetical protein
VPRGALCYSAVALDRACDLMLCAPAVDRLYIDAAATLFERLREFVAIDEIGERVPCRLVVTDVVRIASKRMRRRARRRRAATEALCLPRALALLAVSTISSAGSSRSSGWSCQRVNDERPSPSGFRKAD